MVSPQVIGLGAMNMDYFYRVKSLLAEGEAVVKEAQAFPGGSAANTIYALARLGVPCGFVGAVGGDGDGQRLIADLNRVKVDTRFIAVKARAKTGSVVALVDETGRRALYVHHGANGQLDRADIPLDYLGSAGMVHISAFVGEKQFRWQRDMLPGLAPGLSFAPGALYARRGLEALTPLLKKTLILFLNRQELKELTGADLEAGAERCLQTGCQVVVVTLGKGLRRGQRTCCCLVVQGDKATWVPRPIGAPGQKRIVDTTGAGDAFAAGFLYGYLKGKPLEQCGLLGDLMAGFGIAQLGARTGLPTRRELGQAYQQISGQAL